MNERGRETVKIYVCGVGARRQDGTESGFGWFNPTTRRKLLAELTGVPKIEAEWHALHSALKHIQNCQSVHIITESPFLEAQFADRIPVIGKRSLLRVAAQTYDVIARRQLNVNVVWLPAYENPAAKKLRAALAKRRRPAGAS